MTNPLSVLRERKRASFMRELAGNPSPNRKRHTHKKRAPKTFGACK